MQTLQLALEKIAQTIRQKVENHVQVRKARVSRHLFQTKCQTAGSEVAQRAQMQKAANDPVSHVHVISCYYVTFLEVKLFSRYHDTL